MQLKIIVKWLAFTGAAVMIAYSILIIFLPDTAEISSTQSTASVVQASLDSKLPTRLEIPAIMVDAAIESLGIAPDGTMAVPKGPYNVAWFNRGVRPGENGAAVLAGHEGWRDGIPAVFDNLYKLQKGDVIYVEDGDGTTKFIVRESRLYNPEANTETIFDSSDGGAHLNLITCDGTWDEFSKSYSNRLVVFADKE